MDGVASAELEGYGRLSEDYAAQIADDKDPLRQILRAARAWGVSPSVFMGAPVVTTYQHDAANRMVRAETQQWTAADMEMAAALQAYEAQDCPGCGGQLSETTAAENETRYRTKVSALCHRCVSREVAAKRVEHPHPDALLYTTELLPDP